MLYPNPNPKCQKHDEILKKNQDTVQLTDSRHLRRWRGPLISGPRLELGLGWSNTDFDKFILLFRNA